MGIYLSEINMPKGNDSKLVLQIFPNGEVYDEHGIRLGITNWAKAIPVQPHGQLKDADAVERNLLKMQKAQTGPCSHGVRKSRAVLRDMPTIIPAEEE